MFSSYHTHQSVSPSSEVMLFAGRHEICGVGHVGSHAGLNLQGHARGDGEDDSSIKHAQHGIARHFTGQLYHERACPPDAVTADEQRGEMIPDVAVCQKLEG